MGCYLSGGLPISSWGSHQTWCCGAVDQGKVDWGHGHAQAHPVVSDEEIEEEEETDAGGEGVPRTRSGVSFGGAQSSPQSLEQPGWAAKLICKMKKLFCLQIDVQHRMYQPHVREKQNRQLQYEFYRRQGMTVKAGSEEDITSEDKWFSKFSNWDLDEDVPGSSTSASPATDEPAPVEESEEDPSDEEIEEEEETAAGGAGVPRTRSGVSFGGA